MNAAVRAVVRAGTASGIAVVSIERGYAGMVDNRFREMDRSSVVNIVQRGGTILGTGRCDEFRTDTGRARAVQNLRTHNIDGVVLIGGDGTFRGAQALMAAGGPSAIGIPGTIDNDVFGTDRSLGFDTAVNTALQAIDHIRDTATSHEMLHFIEVMGRDSGWLAVAAGLAGGAEVVLCPEDDHLEAKLALMEASLAAGKRSIIVVVAEGYDDGAVNVASVIGSRLGLDYRVTTLGHTQRGGSPTAADRIMGGQLGTAAVDGLLAGRSGLMVGVKGERVVETPFDETCSTRHAVPAEMLALLSRLG